MVRVYHNILLKKTLKFILKVSDIIFMKQLDGKITITRPINYNCEEYISITVRDELSHSEVIEIKVPLLEFTKALTGQGYMDCAFKYPSQELIGKRRENKTEFVPFDSKYGRVTEEEKAAALKPFEINGWRGRTEDLTNSHNSGTQDEVRGYNVVFIRYLDIED